MGKQLRLSVRHTEQLASLLPLGWRLSVDDPRPGVGQEHGTLVVEIVPADQPGCRKC